MSSNPSRMGIGVLVVVIIAVAGVAGVFLLNRDPAGGGDNPDNDGGTVTDGGGTGKTSRLTADEYAGAFEFANQALGHLENHEYIKAESTFAALWEKLPEENLPLRNLAITQTLMVTDENYELLKNKRENPTAWTQAADAAKETLAELKKSDPEFATFLEGRIYSVDKQYDKAIELLQSAAERAKTNASYWMELYDVHANLRERSDRQPHPLALAGIEKAFELEPENLHVVCELLRTRAKQKGESLTATLKQVRPVIAPLGPSMAKRQRGLVFDSMYDQAISESESGRTVRARQLANLINSELPKRIDQRLIDKDLLEYVTVDFPPKFHADAKAAGYVVSQPPAIKVAFEATGGQLQALTDVTDLCLADMNLDDLPDIVVARNGMIQIYARKASSPDADTPSDWKLVAEVAAEGVSQLRLADLDRDFENPNGNTPGNRLIWGSGDSQPESGKSKLKDTDADIVAFGSRGVLLFRNDRSATDASGFKRTLTPIAIEDEQLTGLTDIVDVALIDIEHDGDLDLLSATGGQLNFWVNKSTKVKTVFGGGGELLKSVPDGESVRSLTPIDWNRDIALDVLVGTDKSVGLLQNVLHSRFRWRDLGVDSGAAVTAIGDFNSDASWDAILSQQGGAHLSTHLSSPASTEGAGWLGNKPIEPNGRGLCLCDYDNDSYQDLVVSGDGKTRLLRGGPEGDFKESLTIADTLTTRCRAADLDLDGDQDLVLATADGVQVLTNNGGNKNNWFRLTLRPEPNPEQFPANRINMHALGSVVELKSGSRYQARAVDGLPIHFGLGQSEAADVVRIIWTDGIPQNIVEDPAPSKSVTILSPQHLAGSCPYIYTWTGDKFEFYSDCLWAAPLGLQLAEGVYAPTREWEYIRIDGNALKPRDGKCQLKITEELWEATYLDHVRLIAVDHPVGTEVYSNEKVGPPGVTEFQIHTVRDPQLPLSATNQNGRDLLPGLRAKDKNYVSAFDTRIKQGLTPENYIEFNLGDVKDADQVTLFMVGWVFPTDTNINIGIAQTGEAPPKPPSIQVADENGQWTEAIPAAGFPGGKTKTVAYDLSGVFKSNDCRVRLVSSMELYWDAAFFTVGPQKVDVKQTELPLVDASLQFRGFSKRTYNGSVFNPRSLGPEGYDYNDVTTIPTWLPMDGNFTKFGDVLPLLTERDDLQVVFGAGDEVALKFAVPDRKLPAGWVRDFLLYNVGWDKDVKQNTVYSTTVEPLPYEGMESYTGADTAFPDTERHRNYLNTWQTRTQNLRQFRNWVREFDTSLRKSSQ